MPTAIAPRPMRPHDVVRLSGCQLPVDIPVSNVHFTFADRRLGYDCHACGSACCRGFGYLFSGSRELAAQVDGRAALTLFIDRPTASPHHFRVHNCPPACFFLDTDGRCNVQARHGYDAKPETCRLFPFNNISRVGAHLIVAPHFGLCPLQVMRPGEESECSAHETLVRGIQAQGIGGEVSELTAGGADVDRLLSFESTIVEESEKHLCDSSYAPFAVRQSACTAAYTGSDRIPAPHDTMFVRFGEVLDRLLGIESPTPSSADQSLVRVLVASTPVLRSQLLFRRVKNDSGTMFPLERVPNALFVLYRIAQLAVASGMNQITFQTLVSLFTKYRPLITVLAHVDCAMVWRDTEKVEWPFGGDPVHEKRYLSIVKALCPRRGQAGPLLGAVLAENLGDDLCGRLPFLRQVAGRLAGRIRMREETERQAPATRWATIGARFQRWALRNVNADVALHVAARRAGPAHPAPPIQA
jgi:Fe-S-cluster containining protein